MNEANRRKEREMVQKEIDKLRGSIQTLTRSVNPLGKIMDFVQEDLDSMQKELENWKTENKTNTKDLQREQRYVYIYINRMRSFISGKLKHNKVKYALYNVCSIYCLFGMTG